MDTRPMTSADLDRLRDLDGTIESSQYLHLERSGEVLEISWKLDERPLRTKLIDSNPLDDERHFTMKQVVNGIDDGIALVAEHDEQVVALLVAQPDAEHGTMRIIDLRVDYDMRREGVGSAMIFQLIQTAREQGLRAVAVEVKANNFPAHRFLAKCGFELAGLDGQRHTNHDVVKELATLFWYAALD